MTDNEKPTLIKPLPNYQCAILVPVGGNGLDQECDIALRALEKQDYVVKREYGHSAIDQARSEMATRALDEGFRELMWIDADIRFSPTDVDWLRRLDLDIVGGVYAKRGVRSITIDPLPGVKEVIFGLEGGLQEVKYCGCGFLFTRARVYRDILNTLELPATNQRYKTHCYPYFLPMVIEDPEYAKDAHLYLCEDFAFQERARQSGHRIFVDTRLRLGHVGTYGYSWEDAGIGPQRHTRFRYVFTKQKPSASK